MNSRVPKVLHAVAGRPLLYFPIAAALRAGAERAVIVTSGNPAIEAELSKHFPATLLDFVTQDPPRGTGDAARIGLAAARAERVLIVYGDTPLVRSEDLSRLVLALDGPHGTALSFMSCELATPSGYGRVLRDEAGKVIAIREDRDLRNDVERRVREVNAGMYAAHARALGEALESLRPNNAQGEYYLTDVVSSFGPARCDAILGHEDALVGVNDRVQLRAAEQRLFQRIAERHGRAGVTIRGDVLIDDGVELEPDVVLEAGVRIRGASRVARGAFIDVGCVLENAEIGEDVRVKPYSVITDSRVDRQAQIGPFSHLRPDSVIEEGAHVGNFVETKKTRMRRGSKANHLAYLGDGDVGERANVGAGTIFCNYDGYQKQRTVIGANAFIGSDSQLVAPITIGEGAYVATGTTVTRDVPADALAIGRARQENKEGYAPRLRGRLEAQRQASKKK